MKKHTAIIACALLALSSLNAATIAWWDFTGLPYGGDFPTGDPRRYEHGPDGFKPVNLAKGVTTTGLHRGSPTTNNKGNPRKAGGWGGVDFSNINEAAALIDGRYFYFTLVADVGTLSLTSIAGTLHTSATGPHSAQWEYAINGSLTYTKIGGVINLTTHASDVPFDFGLSNENWANAKSVTFRIVAWGGDHLTGTLYLDSLAVHGEVIPEPSTTLLLGVGAVFIAFSRRRRK